MRLFDWAHRIDLQEEIQEIFLHRLLFKLAVGTVAIFLPLYLHQLGFPAKNIILFFLAFFTALGLGSPLLVPPVHRIGYKKSSLLSSALILPFYLLMRSLTTTTPLIYPTAALGGLGFALYWTGMNAEMARNSHETNRGKETGIFFSLPALATVIAPFLGGAVISLYGFKSLFLLAASIMALSFTPFLLTPEHHSGRKLTFRDMFHRTNLNDLLTYIFIGFSDIGKAVLWPLYLALIITGSLNIGAAGSLLGLGSALASILIGKLVNDGNKTQTLTIGGIFLGLSWAIMVWITTPLQALLISFINGILLYTIRIPVYTKMLHKARKKDILEYVAFRETSLGIGRILMLLTLLILTTQTSPFLLGFTAIALSTLPALWFARKM